MTEPLSGEDSEPSERIPAGPLYVPVRSGPLGHAARMFRTPLGDRTAVGFSSERALVVALGPAQSWIRLAEPALRAMTAPLGVTTVTVDPQLTAPTPAFAERSRAHRRGGRDPQVIGAPRVTATAALATAVSYVIG
ncbi:SAV_915 family protein [Streptomyces sp. NPDC046939]|uniref:SAV_915 family protein n=1 Tax=Streptomyces sp. NPDC046939 TaxID=3155376 RepID=UPI0033CFDD34